MDEYAFSFINVNNGELLSQWGRTGEGPEEFIDFGSGFEIVDSRIVFLDRMKKDFGINIRYLKQKRTSGYNKGGLSL